MPGNRWDLLDGQWPAAPPEVSVVVVHYDQPRQLARTLAALARQTHPAQRLEVLVVDDGSPTPPRVPDGVTLLLQPDRGFRAAAARNAGAARARGEVLCFLDADTAPEPDYIRQLTRLPALAPEAVAVGRREHADLTGVDPATPVESAGPALRLPAPAWLARGYAESGDLLAADDRSYRFVISAVLACDRGFFAATGGFDDAFGAYGGEDWEWAHRAWLAGALLAHVPRAVAWHDGPDWSGRDADDRARRAQKNAEAIRLAAQIPVAGSRGRALRAERPDVLARLATAGSVGAAYLCVDGLLAALPEATVVVPDAVAGAFAGDPRVVAEGAAAAVDRRATRLGLELPRPVRIVGGGLRAATDRVGSEALGTLELVGADGVLMACLRSARAEARAERWGTAEHFPTARALAAGLTLVGQEPDLEAWLGGWG